MSRLSYLVHRIVEDGTDAFGRMNTHKVVEEGMLLLDKEDKATLAREALWSRVNSAATKLKRLTKATVSNGAPSLSLFPDLKPRYSVDVAGRQIVLTEALSRVEFRRVIDIRQKQIKDDGAHLKVLEDAYKAVSPFWDANPDLSFWEVCQLRLAQPAPKKGRFA